MVYHRGDIVEIPLTMPDSGRIKAHPVIIISNKEVHDADDCYIGVMITHNDRIDQFSFELSNDMFEPAMQERRTFQARCHLITYFLQSHITKGTHRNRMKANFIDQLVTHVTTSALN